MFNPDCPFDSPCLSRSNHPARSYQNGWPQLLDHQTSGAPSKRLDRRITRYCRRERRPREQPGHPPSLPEGIPVHNAPHFILLRQKHPQKRQIVTFASVSAALSKRKPAAKRPRGRSTQPTAAEPFYAPFSPLQVIQDLAIPASPGQRPLPKNRLPPDRIAFTLGAWLGTNPLNEERREKERAPPKGAPTTPQPFNECDCHRESVFDIQ